MSDTFAHWVPALPRTPAQPTDPLALLDVNQSRLTRSRVEAPSEEDTQTFENEMGAAIAAAQTEAS